MLIILPQNITLDPSQESLLSKFKDLLVFFEPKTLKNIFARRGRKRMAGLYIHGSVGSGKTMLSKAFFDAAECPKVLMHYQSFIKSIHQALHDYQENLKKKNAITILAKSYAKRAKLLCLDEFEIKDITDAMIIGRLFAELIRRKVFIIITTNTAPENLYKDGLQRDLFLPFIDLIRKSFDVFTLSAGYDYRMLQIASFKSVLYPFSSPSTQNEILKIINHLTDNQRYSKAEVEVFGRKLLLQRTYKSVLVTNFDELCKENLSYNDYIAICERFKTIVMENVPIIKASENNEIIRFINFIDNVYFNHNMLFITLAAKPEELYVSGARLNEFKRTISRLHEMESDEYKKSNQ